MFFQYIVDHASGVILRTPLDGDVCLIVSADEAGMHCSVAIVKLSVQLCCSAGGSVDNLLKFVV